MLRIRFLTAALVSLAALAMLSVAAVAAPSEPLRPFERIGHVPSPGAAARARAVAPARATGIATVAVNAAWSALSPGTPVTVGANGYIVGTSAFAAVQAGIDAVDPGGTVLVLPGTYSETASGRTLAYAGGTYQFGLFFGLAKGAITLQGVDASGNAITSAAAVAATIYTNGTADFGPDGIFVEGDGVTIAGVRIGTNSAGQNKTIEVTGDAFTLRDCDVADPYGSLYVSDWDFDVPNDLSHVRSYHVTGNTFADGCSIDFASGAGYTGPASGRVISGNTFVSDAVDVYWPAISFNGSGTGVPWFVQSVGGAVITGNTFQNDYPQGQHIRARGTYDNSQFAWGTYFSGNTYTRAAVVGATPPATVTPYSYVSGPYTMNDVRRVGASIQGEVDHGLAGDIVLVAPGTYVEQVLVDGRNLTVRGAGRAATTLRAPASLPASFTSSAANHPVFLASNAADIRLEQLTVDAAGMGAGNYRLTGVAWSNAGGRLVDADVVHVRDTPFSGNQHGTAVYVYESGPGAYAFEMGGCNLSDFQKNGTVFYGPGLTVNVHDCTVTGQGPTTLNAQNGIETYDVASCTVTNVTVTGLFYTPATYSAAGLLALYGGTVNLSGNNVFTGCQSALYYVEANGTAAGCHVSGSTWAANFENDQASAANGASRVAAGRVGGPPAPSPFSVAPAPTRAFRALSAAMSAAITNGCFTGTGEPGGQGVWAYSAGGPTSVSVTGMEITGFDIGVAVQGAASLAADHDAITANLTSGLDDTSTGGVTAPYVWWGSAGGPGTGGANPVTGAGATFSPWLVSGADTNSGCGFAAGPDNVIAIGPAPSCIDNAHACITVPVTIARTTSDAVRGYSVTFQLSSNLALCAGAASVHEGGYLAGIGTTHFEAVDHHDGSWTVDCAILGLPCGATAAAGSLFTLDLARAGLDGPASVTITSVTVRDCDNLPVAATAGAPLAITVDTAAPAAMSGITAIPQATGNGAGFTSRIQLVLTPPSGAASVEVWRKGYGQYPEYDDAGGAVPAMPVGYPPAGWTLTGITASGQYDQPATRDFWYYVAYSHDACGNVSAVSNMTSGTLDYHLGDVVNPGNPLAQGDNLVDGADISRLGAHYGISLVLNDPYNALDVGPTTNYSVNARPTTDNLIGFEDLMVFAIDYGVVSAPQGAAKPAAAGRDAIALDVPALPAIGETFAVPVRLQGTGAVQGASVQLAWNPAVVEPAGVEAGELLARQSRGSVVLSGAAGGVDFALLGTGAGITGDGDAAHVLFRVKAAGDPGIGLAHVTARDAANAAVTLDAQGAATAPVTPLRTELGTPYPNPFGHTATLQLSIAHAAPVRVAVFDLAGRRVRTLLDSVQPAGVRVLVWDGRGDAGVRMAPGVYVIRMVADGAVQSRRVQLVP